MSDSDSRQPRQETRSDMERQVARKEQRRLKALRTRDRTVWFGLGMFGVVGWSIAVPMLLGIALGLWIDAQRESQRSWTLMLMMAGLGIGCLNAWGWMTREAKIPDEPPPADEPRPEQQKPEKHT